MRTEPIADQTVAGFLEALASDAPTPGGGAAAGIAAALGAALVSMVANLTTNDETGQAAAIGAEAARLRREALAAADDDATAFGAVSEAYRMPKDDASARTAAIQSALAGAVEPPLAIIAIAADVARVAGELLPIANRNVVSDIAVACRCAAAAVDGAAANVLVNVSLMKDEGAVAAVWSRFEPARRQAVAQANDLATRVEAGFAARP